MSINKEKFAIVIPTFRRAYLLKELLNTFLSQTILPTKVVIVDGDPSSLEVKSMLEDLPIELPLIYIPSNHANAPYQRYLGAKVAADYDLIIFIDDDIRITQKDALEKILIPFLWGNRSIVGVGPKINFPSRSKSLENRTRSKYLEFLGSSYWLSPGALTPSGDRVPIVNTWEDYVPVDCLRGGVMAYQSNVLSKVIYSEDVFALSHIHCGLGADDTYLSRCVGLYGELLQANCAIVEHPDMDISRVYPANMVQLGYAKAYSRRFLNDHYRLNEKTRFSDRKALMISYIWAFLVNWAKAIDGLNRSKIAYAWGYTRGILSALLLTPTAKNLAPDINWRADAIKALADQVETYE